MYYKLKYSSLCLEYISIFFPYSLLEPLEPLDLSCRLGVQGFYQCVLEQYMHDMYELGAGGAGGADEIENIGNPNTLLAHRRLMSTECRNAL